MLNLTLPLALFFAISIGGQEPPKTPEANPKDVASIDSILKATYDVISGAKGQERDWDRMRSLFVPNAPLGACVITKKGDNRRFATTAEGYIKEQGHFLVDNGFFEREIHRHVDRFGNVIQVFSTYESRSKADDPKPFERGVNSFQLYFDGNRYWIISIFWQGEDAKTPIPKEWLD